MIARLLPLLALLGPAPALANDYEVVSDRETFVELVDGRSLRLGVLGIDLKVTADGRIGGSASGWDVTGSWSWEDGFFCREMDWGGMAIDYNCQLVEVRGTQEMRFTVDQGAGETASFNLR